MNKTNSSKNGKLLAIFLGALLTVGCSDAPFHTVYDGDNVVYAVKNSDSKHGRYEYWIDDGSDQGWTLRSNQKFNVGDKLEIIKPN